MTISIAAGSDTLQHPLQPGSFKKLFSFLMTLNSTGATITLSDNGGATASQMTAANNALLQQAFAAWGMTWIDQMLWTCSVSSQSDITEPFSWEWNATLQELEFKKLVVSTDPLPVTSGDLSTGADGIVVRGIAIGS